MNCSMPCFPVLHHLPEFAQKHVSIESVMLSISSSATLFSFCLQSFPASGSFLMSQLFASGGQSIAASASASVLPMNIQGWFPLGLTDLISLLSQGLSSKFSRWETNLIMYACCCCCCCCYVASVMSNSVWPHRWQPTRLLSLWDSPGKNAGVGCHFLLQCMKVKSESEVAQSCPTLSDPMECCISPLFQVSFPFRSPQSTDCSPLC